MIRTAIIAAALALSPPAQAWSYYLLPQPYTKVCEPGEPLGIDWTVPGEIQFACWHGAHLHKHYVGLTITSDCGQFMLEARSPHNDGWYRITCHLVTE